ncbi:hypothetical protein BDBG_05036 [Blastomyces gilchristii SLH14081]|uniref:Uncharacterized protein n=1 Tax=Blastomyces gilchristii (strain SLH14081) TaxID=559298 RepID=A0A179UNK7_BLAGS|nr:uncharacterized protein BDBG_05036 [Blastomyces gilchristii SLH14081]OAT08809.1 hypothetical protein BDBG_05036 [Blastomyces gilchristii SLH14081]
MSKELFSSGGVAIIALRLAPLIPLAAVMAVFRCFAMIPSTSKSKRGKRELISQPNNGYGRRYSPSEMNTMVLKKIDSQTQGQEEQKKGECGFVFRKTTVSGGLSNVPVIKGQGQPHIAGNNNVS